MITFEPLEFESSEWRRETERSPDRTIYQTPEWISFVAETQHARPLVAAIRDDNQTIGYFTGLKFRKFGLTVLGSPFPGWSTAYMGFNLHEGVPRHRVVDAFADFALAELGCSHIELMDRHLSAEDLSSVHCASRVYTSFEVDLRPGEKELLSKMAHEKRTNLRKAEKNGLRVEEATDLEFAEEYYAQLAEVFQRQSLAPTYPLERVRALIQHLLPTGKLLLLRVRDREERCIATCISLGEGKTGYVWGAASWREHQILRPNELMFWHTFRYWKSRGAETLDLTGNSDYKARYGAYRIHIPWLQKSKYPFIGYLRNSAQEFFRLKQRLSGKWLPGNTADAAAGQMQA
jgi:CelD/BcsL family acetyltransferase involved in cellulose biosynthesis